MSNASDHVKHDVIPDTNHTKPLYEQLSVVNLVAAMAEFIMIRTGDSNPKAGHTGDTYTITAAGHTIRESSKEKAVESLLRWTLAQTQPYTQEELDRHAELALAEEQKITEEMIQKLTEGGLPPEIQQMREVQRNRTLAIYRALSELAQREEFKARKVTVNEIIDEVRSLSKMPDIEPGEVLAILLNTHEVFK